MSAATASPVISTVASWEGEGVTLGQVEAALGRLRRDEQRAAVRTAVLTFVVVIDDRDQAPEILEVVRDLGGRHPSRTVVLVLDDDDDGKGIDAEASLHAAVHDGRSICFEDLVLSVRGAVRWHLDSLVEPFTLPDLPVAVWSPFRLPSIGDPLLAAADRILIDSRFVPATEDYFRRVAGLARRFPIADLSWIRLAPWRSLLASLFDGACATYASGVHRAEVAGHFGPRHLLGGWLASSLRIEPSIVDLQEAEHVSIRLDASSGGSNARLAVERLSDERTIVASVEVANGFSQQQTLRMRDMPRSLVLADALGHMGRDEVYERALFGALELLR